MTETQRIMPAVEPPLVDTLRLLLPCADTALLLRATVLEGDVVRDSWLEWRRRVPNPNAYLAADRVGIKRHLPLLYRNLVTNGVDMGRDLEPYFRAARAREELRSTRYRRFLGEALTALRGVGVQFVVGKGVTIGESIHTDPVVRHSHDIDLLVRPEDIAAASDALRGAGFVPPSTLGTQAEPRFDHQSGLPVELHDRLYRTPFYDGDLHGLWNRARDGEILGIPVRLISDIDLLIQAPVHASVVAQRYNLSWIIDVVTLIQRRERDGIAIDWAAATRIGIDSHAALPLYVMYRYLAATFDAPIPGNVISEFRAAASRTGVLQHLAATEGVRADPRQRRIKVIVEASGWRSRAILARAALFPPPRYLRAKNPQASSLRLAWMYLSRPLRFVARQINRFQFRLRQRWLVSKTTPSQPNAAVENSSATGRSLI